MSLPHRTRTLLAGAAGFVFIIATSESMAQALLDVSAQIEEQCEFSTTTMALAFGIYTGQQITRTADFTFSCPPDKSLSFTLTGGQDDGGSTMFLPHSTDPGATDLLYQILNPNDGTMINGAPWNYTSAGGEETKSLTGVLAGGQTGNGFSPGTYSQTLTFTMTVNP